MATIRHELERKCGLQLVALVGCYGSRICSLLINIYIYTYIYICSMAAFCSGPSFADTERTALASSRTVHGTAKGQVPIVCVQDGPAWGSEQAVKAQFGS